MDDLFVIDTTGDATITPAPSRSTPHAVVLGSQPQPPVAKVSGIRIIEDNISNATTTTTTTTASPLDSDGFISVTKKTKRRTKNKPKQKAKPHTQVAPTDSDEALLDYIANAGLDHIESDPSLDTKASDESSEDTISRMLSVADIGPDDITEDWGPDNIVEDWGPDNDLGPDIYIPKTSARKAKVNARKAKTNTRKAKRDKHKDTNGPSALFDPHRIISRLDMLASTTDLDEIWLEPMNTYERRIVHMLASHYNVKSKSRGGGDKRMAVLSRTPKTKRPTNMRGVSRVLTLHEAGAFEAESDRWAGTKLGKGKNKSRNKKRSGKTESDGKTVGADAPEVGSSNVGHQMLAKLGWTPGQGLGVEQEGRATPVDVVIRNTRKGLGA